jgi:transketolase
MHVVHASVLEGWGPLSDEQLVSRILSGHMALFEVLMRPTMAHILWTRDLRHNPRNPAWPDRDRFVRSARHASMLNRDERTVSQ